MRCETLILAVVATVLASSLPTHAQSVSDMLEKGIFTEETVGDLDAAIKIYEQIVAEGAKNRSYAAQAQYRVGMCYLKQGRKDQAVAAFQMLIEQFSKQTELAAQAKVRLLKLGHAPGRPVPAGMTVRRVWQGSGVDIGGSPSLDGRYLSFTDWSTGDVAIRDLATGENRRLTNKVSWWASEEFADMSQMSPDGKQVVYTWHNGESLELRVVGLDGSKPRILYRAEIGEYPAGWWTGNGSVVAAVFNRRLDSTTDVLLISTADGSTRLLKNYTGPLRVGWSSPDGRYVALNRPRDEESPEHDIFLLATDGSGETPLIEHPADDRVLGWSRDGSWLLFRSDRAGSDGAWIQRVTGGTAHGPPRLIKSNFGKVTPIGFTQDGSFYYGIRSGTTDAYTAPLDLAQGKGLGSPTPVTDRYVGRTLWPSWSHDGKHLTYVSVPNAFSGGRGPMTIVIRSLETGEERELQPDLRLGVAPLARPSLSPNGKTVLLIGTAEGKGGLYQVDAYSGEVTLLVEDSVSLPAWAPDGKRVFYKRGARLAGPGDALVSRDLGTGQESLVYHVDALQKKIGTFSVSPSGRELAFILNDQPTRSQALMVLPSAGGEARELLRVQEPDFISRQAGLAWTPDGREIVFRKNFELWGIPAPGGEPRKLAPIMPLSEVGAADPSSRKPAGLVGLQIHPDGNRMAFTARGETNEVWVMENFLPEPKVATASGPVTRQVWAPALDTMGTVSPNGRYISYVNWDMGNLAVHDVQTGEDRDVTDEGSWDTPNKFCDVSIWSPDSRHIAYLWIDRGTGSHLQIIGLDGSKPRVLASSDTVRGHAPWPRAWSQDGKYILALFGEEDASQERGHEDHIVLVSVADGSLRVLKKLGKQHTQFMSLSPDGRYVVFDLGAKHGSKKRDIHLVATDGSIDIPLVEHPADDGVPFWTPDGKRIVFLSDRSGSKGLWMLDMDDGKPNGNPKQIRNMGSRSTLIGFTRDGSLHYSVGIPSLDVYVATLDFEAGKVLAKPAKESSRFEGSNFGPFWSPDGNYLAYASQRSAVEGYVLVIRSVETGEERDISPESLRMGGAHIHAPRWSPDGSSILVAAEGKGVSGHFLVDAQTGDFTPVAQSWRETEKATSGPAWPVFSKDGKQIYYVRDRSIMAQSLETGRERELYRAKSYINRLACSPDGRRLAFFGSSKVVAPTVVLTIPVSGGEPRVLYTLKEGIRFHGGVGISWTPDGRHVIVGRSHDPDKPDELWSIPATGGEPRKLNLGFKVKHMSLHPDGRRIAFTVGEYTSEVWAMENFLPEPTAAP